MQRLVGVRPGGAGSRAADASGWSSPCPPTSPAYTGRDGRRIVEPGDLELRARRVQRRPAVLAFGSPRRHGSGGGSHPAAAAGGRGRGRARGIRDLRRSRRRRRTLLDDVAVRAPPLAAAAAPCSRARRGSWRGPCAAWGRPAPTRHPRSASARRMASRAASSAMCRRGWWTVVRGGLEPPSQWYVVVAHHRQVLGYTHAAIPGRLHDAECLEVAAGEDRGRPVGRPSSSRACSRPLLTWKSPKRIQSGSISAPPCPSPSGSRRPGRANTSCLRGR